MHQVIALFFSLVDDLVVRSLPFVGWSFADNGLGVVWQPSYWADDIVWKFFLDNKMSLTFCDAIRLECNSIFRHPCKAHGFIYQLHVTMNWSERWAVFFSNSVTYKLFSEAYYKKKKWNEMNKIIQISNLSSFLYFDPHTLHTWVLNKEIIVWREKQRQKMYRKYNFYFYCEWLLCCWIEKEETRL